MTSSIQSRLGTAPEEGCKAPVKTVANNPITLSGEQTINTVAVVAGDRVLVNGQVDAATNGIYNVSTTTWTYAKDWNKANDVIAGMLVPSSETVELYQLKPYTGTFTAGTTEVEFQTGVVSSRKYERQTGASASGTTFTLSGMTYVPNTYDLEVEHNGQVLITGQDYTELSSTTVQILQEFSSTSDFVFKSNQTVTLTTTTTSSVTHTQSGTTYNLSTYLQNKHVVSVMDYGAAADGTTDDTAAFQAACDSSDRVYVPAGNYKISSVNLNKGQIISGDGFSDSTGTTIEPTAGQNAFVISGDFVEIYDLEFRDISMVNAEDETTLEANCIYTDAYTANIKHSSGGTTDGSTGLITGITFASGYFEVNDKVTVSAGFPSTTALYTITAVTANSITLDTNSTSATSAVVDQSNFLRLIQGCKIERCQFVNIKGAAIYINQALRESHIKNCRIFGMGDRDTTVGGIHCYHQLGTGTNVNNLFIRDNIMYRFATPPINFIMGSVVASTSPQYSDIHITGNLIHNQRLDSSVRQPGQAVEAEETNNIVVNQCGGVFIQDNRITSVHPDYTGIRVSGNVDYENRHIDISNNRISNDTGRTDLTYPGIGNLVRVSESRVLVFVNNTIGTNSADRPNSDLTVTRTSVSPMNVTIAGNVSVNQPLDFVLPEYDGFVEVDGKIQGRVEPTTYLSLGSVVDYTIAAGSINPTSVRCRLTAAAGGPTDNFDGMAETDLRDGDMFIFTAIATDTITVRDGVNKFDLNGDAVLVGASNDQLTVVYDATSGTFYEQSRVIH